MKISNIIVSCLLATLLGCSDDAAEKFIPLKTFKFELGHAAYEIQLPESYEMHGTTDQVSFSLLERNSKPLELQTGQNNNEIKHRETIELDTGKTLRYSISAAKNIGSGGQESKLTGLISFASTSLILRCGDQNELTSPDSKWCLQYLRFLKEAD